MAKQATRKRSIAPVRLTITVEATKINENGTFSSFSLVSAKGPNSTFTASFPPMGGGSIYLKVLNLDNVEVLAEGEQESAAPRKKLF